MAMVSKTRKPTRAGIKAAMFNWGGVCRLARNTSSITKSKKARSAQPNQVVQTGMYESVSSRRSGLSQNSLCGRLIIETGIAAIMRGMLNETTVASTMIANSIEKNVVLVCQAL